VRVASFNLHAGIDGWGRPTRALEHASQLDVDILVCPELWRGDQGPDLFTELCARLGMKGLFVPLARGERVTSSAEDEPGCRYWRTSRANTASTSRAPRSLQAPVDQTLVARRARDRRMGTGTADEVAHRGDSRRTARSPHQGEGKSSRHRRATLIGWPTVLRNGRARSAPESCSHRQYRQLNELAASLEPALPTILAGDFNCWRPLLRVLLPGWRTLVRARTWPARFPHSQIDHVLGRGPWLSLGVRRLTEAVTTEPSWRTCSGARAL